MFNWTNTTIPKITDVLNGTHVDPAKIFTYPWVSFMGAWFYAWVIGAIAASLYIKYRKASISLVFFIISIALISPIMPRDVTWIIGFFVAFMFGFILYQLFIGKEEAT